MNLASADKHYFHLNSLLFSGYPSIVVKNLTRDNIERALAICTEDDTYYLKGYSLFGVIKIGDLDRLLEESFQKTSEIFRDTEEKSE